MNNNTTNHPIITPDEYSIIKSVDSTDSKYRSTDATALIDSDALVVQIFPITWTDDNIWLAAELANKFYAKGVQSGMTEQHAKIRKELTTS